MIIISKNISIQDDELFFSFCKSGGPGGQNVNKVSTAAELRFNIKSNSSLPEEVKERLYRIAGKRVTNDGILLITSQQFRTQERNRKNAFEKLIQLIQKAEKKPTPRIKTTVSKSIKEKRFKEKQILKLKKNLRRTIDPFE